MKITKLTHLKSVRTIPRAKKSLRIGLVSLLLALGLAACGTEASVSKVDGKMSGSNLERPSPPIGSNLATAPATQAANAAPKEIITHNLPPICTPEKGCTNWKVKDTESVIVNIKDRIRGGSQHNPVWGNSSLVGPAVTRKTGRAFVALVTMEDRASDLAIQWATSDKFNELTQDGYGWINDSGNLAAIRPGLKVVLDASSHAMLAGQYLVTIVLNDQGAYTLLSTVGTDNGREKQGPLAIPAYPQARLIWSEANGTANQLFPSISFLDSGAGWPPYPSGQAVEGVRVVDLSGDWAKPNGLATVSDRFDRADSPTGLGISSSGATWSVDRGNWSINQGRAYGTNSTGTEVARAWLPAPADGLFQWDVTIPQSGIPGFGLTLRRVSEGNYIQLALKDGNNMQIQAIANGKLESTIAAIGFSWRPGQTYRITAATQGNQYRVWADEQDVFNEWKVDGDNHYLNGSGMGILVNGPNAAKHSFANLAHFPHQLTLPAEIGQGPVPMVKQGGEIVAQDSFKDLNYKRLQSHKPETGPTWNEKQGFWLVKGNQISLDPIEGTNRVTQSLDVNNGEASVDIVTPPNFPTSTLRVGVVLREADQNNYTIVRLYKDSGTSEIELLEVIDGVARVVHKVDITAETVKPSTTYNLRVQAFNDLILVFLDNQPRLAYYTLAVSPLGKQWGLYRENIDDGAIFDNWTVKTLN